MLRAITFISLLQITITMRLIKSIAFTILLVSAVQAEQTAVWIGMSAPMHGEREGIYRATLDTKTGALTQPKLAAEIGSPEFLALRPNGKQLYAACQLPKGGGGVAAYEISDDTSSLRLLNAVPTGGGQSCHVAVDRTGHCLFSAQYGDGNVTALPLAPDGKIVSQPVLIRHTGSGPNRQRQEGPHPHFVGTDPENKFLFVPDLGADRVVIYKLDAEKCGLEKHGAGTCPPGSGPRHFVFHPNHRFAYVVNEMKITVTAFRYAPAAGTLKEIQTIESLPEKDKKIFSTAAEIYIHPSGKFLYASTRNDDTITTFEVDSESGRLKFVEREPIRGSHPRSFNLDPGGKWLLAAGRDSNTISVFRIDEKTGRLIFNNHVVNTPSPICVVMQPVRSQPD
jgi:6-phosphogluconolactonase